VRLANTHFTCEHSLYLVFTARTAFPSCLPLPCEYCSFFLFFFCFCPLKNYDTPLSSPPLCEYACVYLCEREYVRTWMCLSLVCVCVRARACMCFCFVDVRASSKRKKKKKEKEKERTVLTWHVLLFRGCACVVCVKCVCLSVSARVSHKRQRERSENRSARERAT